MKALSVLALFVSFFPAVHLNAQTFRNPERIPTTQDPISVFTVDVNGDGVPDLLYETQGKSTTPSTMSIFFGQSSGGYIAGPTLTLPQNVLGCRPLDANRDGKTDLSCLNLIDEYDVEIATFLGNGDGTFQAPIYSAPMQSQVGNNAFFGWIFTPADVNSDGIPDLLVGDLYDEWIFVLLGDGTGRYTVKSILGGYPASDVWNFSADAATGITVADLNGDGKPDLAFSNGPIVALGNGDGTFQTPNTFGGGAYFSCVFHDMDGDGHPDAVCGNLLTGSELAILHGNADGSFNTTPIFTRTYLNADVPLPVALLDLNGDGILDIVATSSDGLEVLLGEPGLQFADPVHYVVGYSASNGEQSSQLTDMNHDGHVDVVAAGPNGIYISYGNANGTFNTAPAYEVAQVLGHVAVADFNGDGIPDIVATGDQSIELSLGNGDGTFKPYTSVANGGIDFSTGGAAGDAQLVHGDFRGNGKQDLLAIGSPSFNVFNGYLLFGNGDGTFGSPQQVPNFSTEFPAFYNMAVLDINKDGRDDVLTMDASHIYWALSNGDGMFNTVTTTIPVNPSGMNPSFPVFADFGHSGHLDAAYGMTSSVQVLKGHGDGTFDTTGVNLPIPAYQGQNPFPNSIARVATGDFDGDGNPDIAVLTEINSQVSPWTGQILTVAYVYYGKGDGTFSSPVLAGAFNREYTGIFAVDVNKDGLSDLILQTSETLGGVNAPSGDALGVLLSEPGRAFGPEVNYTGGSIESGLLIADLNGDGYPDLLAINSGFFANGDHMSNPPNTVTELLNLGTQPSGGSQFTSTVLSSSSNPATVNTPITFTATVTAVTASDGVPTGSVTFADQTGIHTTVPLVAVSSSQASATFTTSAIGIGTDIVTANYSGDSVFAASTDNLSQVVTGYPVQITFTATPNPVVAGQTATLTATVANPTGTSAASPTGSVTFSDGATNLTAPITLTAGAATYNATFSVAGIHPLTASYSGDTLHAPNSATLNEQVLSGSTGTSKEWVWIGGSDSIAGTCNQYNNCGPPGVYGTLGSPAAANVPGARSSSSTWIDSSGNLWLFGGLGLDANGKGGELNDLWKFNPATNEWTWMSGSNALASNCLWTGYCGPSGVYGTLHTPAAGNVPGGRSYGVSWMDRSGHLWLFGGFGIDANGNLGYLNDLWEFDPTTSQWAWMSGSSQSGIGGLTGVYGTLGTPAAGNVPSGRSSAVSWIDSNGRLWLFSGLGADANGILGYLNEVWVYDPSTQLWAWMGGSNTIGNICGYESNCGRPGVYGTLGTPAAGNIPGGRQLADAWTDSSGNAWIFGGLGFDSQGGLSALNDLWKFNPSTNQWTWMGGSSTIASNGGGQPTVYGTEGVPAPGNNPGGHYQSAHWIDENSHLWLFGGEFSPANNASTTSADQWEFNPSTNEWTWWGGSSSQYTPAVYGTLGVAAPGNFPGNRSAAMAWSNSSGNPWLFGGSNGLNDLWTYQPVSASPAAAPPTFNPPAGTYASAQSVSISDTTLGATIYYTTNGTTPTTGSSVYSAPITVSSSEIIEAIATASGYAASAVATATYTIATPAATPTFNPPAGAYATAQSVSISDTTPGTTIYYTTNGTTPTTSSSVYSTPITVSTSETLKAIAIASGYSTSPVASAAYTITSSGSETREWVWIGGSDSVAGTCNVYGNCGPPGVYGTLGSPAAANVPGGRFGASNWTDSSGNLWLFGGDGFDANGNLGELNDLWKFNPATSQWMWISGSRSFNNTCANIQYCGVPGVYGTLHTPAAGNVPGARSDGISWMDRSGHLWLFGGFGIDANGDLGYLNDLWEFNPATGQWAWMSGGSTAYTPAVYGTLGTPAAGNVPGARQVAASWIDSSGRLWLFSGLGADANGTLGYLNDVWVFDPSTELWAWMGGSSTIGNICGMVDNCGRPGVYGTLGTPAAGNIPGGRQAAAAWTDSSGNAWLFGGFGFDSQGGWSALNDLWKFNSSTNQWTWMGGSSTIASNGGGQPTVYGTEGVPAPGNNPGGHYQSAHWIDGNGHLWFFGGWFSTAFDTGTEAGDQWEFNPSTNEWTWWGGYSSQYNAAVYGTLGVAASGNFPGHRDDAMAWSNSSGNPWLFGGGGYDLNDKPGFLNDLWTYQPAPALPAAAAPTFNPPAGTYSTAQSVTISDTTPGATIYYTTNGTTPTTGSSVYSAPITVSSSETIEAIATASGYSTSPVASATYTIATSAAATPTFNPPAGTYSNVQNVAINDATPGAVIYYTIDGTTPTTSSSIYSAPIIVAKSETLKAFATAAGYSASAVGSATYTITLPTTTTLTASPNPASFGTTVTFTATVTSATAVSAGSVGFYDGSVLLATKPVASGVATYPTSSLSVGSHNITAVYTAGAGFNNSTSNTVVEVISPADFTISASPSAQTIYEGEAASYRITIKPGVGFDLPVALSCTQLPANTTCKFSPATVSGGSGSTTLTVQTSAPGKAATSSAKITRVGTPVFAAFLLIFIPRRFRRFSSSWPMFLALSIALGIAITGCGTLGSLTGGTPVGAQTVTVTGIATNGSQTLTHATTVTLNVKSLF
jgi:N-acetylneuraminic acid mutarotase